MNNSKILITGAGRCGTTFLIKLLSLLGLPTGIKYKNNLWYMTHYQEPIISNGQAIKVNRKTPHSWTPSGQLATAGLEYHICPKDDIKEVANLPKILKNPRFCTLLKELIDNKLMNIELIMVCIRDLDEIAKSKYHLSKEKQINRNMNKTIQDFKNESCAQLGTLYTTLAMYKIPNVVLVYPKMILDEEYLFEKLKYFNINYDYFKDCYLNLVDKKLSKNQYD